MWLLKERPARDAIAILLVLCIRNLKHNNKFICGMIVLRKGLSAAVELVCGHAAYVRIVECMSAVCITGRGVR